MLVFQWMISHLHVPQSWMFIEMGYQLPRLFHRLNCFTVSFLCTYLPKPLHGTDCFTVFTIYPLTDLGSQGYFGIQHRSSNYCFSLFSWFWFEALSGLGSSRVCHPQKYIFYLFNYIFIYVFACISKCHNKLIPNFYSSYFCKINPWVWLVEGMGYTFLVNVNARHMLLAQR